MWIDTMPHTRIATNQDELLKYRAFPTALQQPEQTFDGNIHNSVRGIFTGCQMQHMSHTTQRLIDNAAFGNRAAHNFQSRMRSHSTIVAQCPHDKMLKSGICQQSSNKSKSDF